MTDIWEVYALKYNGTEPRTRGNSFIFEDNHDGDHAIDYFIWLLKCGDRMIVVDTGYDEEEAKRRGNKTLTMNPAQALRDFGVDPALIDTIIITHLHFDHAGGLKHFPNAKFHLQAAEMAFATGPCMCEQTIGFIFTGEHICEMVKNVYSGRVIFHDGEGEVASGVTVHCVGGHSRGLQVISVMTKNGPLCLASDATHFYENYLTRKPCPIYLDLEETLKGFDTIQQLAVSRDFVIPGHDPLVTEHFPVVDNCDFAWRLDVGPSKPF